jgi:hypothetical protein
MIAPSLSSELGEQVMKTVCMILKAYPTKKVLV